MQSSPHASSGQNGSTTIPSQAEQVESKTNDHALAAASARAAGPKDFDSDLRDRLEVYRAASGASIADIGKDLGYPDGTAVSKYLNKKPEGDVLKLERAVADLLKGVSRRQSASTSLFETQITRRLDSVTESLRRIGGVGLLYGAAGIGKTCACQWHGLHHPTAIILSINQWDRSPNRIETLLFEALGHQQLRSRGRARPLDDRPPARLAPPSDRRQRPPDDPSQSPLAF